jgi:Zn-dependent oligopeptidase
MSKEAGLKDETVVNRKSCSCLATDRAPAHAAGYFSYKWAEVLSADAFSAFEEVGLENKSAVKETGRRFRDTVLALGGGRAPADVFKVQCTPAHDACEASLAMPGNQFMETGRRFTDTVLALGGGRAPALVLRAETCIHAPAHTIHFTACSARGYLGTLLDPSSSVCT